MVPTLLASARARARADSLSPQGEEELDTEFIARVLKSRAPRPHVKALAALRRRLLTAEHALRSAEHSLTAAQLERSRVQLDAMRAMFELQLDGARRLERLLE